MKNELRQGLNLVSIKTILSWYPGDYMYECTCPEEQFHHTCKSIGAQWQHILDIVRYDERYYDILDSVRSLGVAAPLRAKFINDKEIMFVDGHNRVSCCVDLKIKEAFVYIGSVEENIHDLIAPDSHWWTAGGTPWPLDTTTYE